MAEFFCETEENTVTLTPKQFELMESTLRLTTEQRECLNDFLATAAKPEEEDFAEDNTEVTD